MVVKAPSCAYEEEFSDSRLGSGGFRISGLPGARDFYSKHVGGGLCRYKLGRILGSVHRRLTRLLLEMDRVRFGSEGEVSKRSEADNASPGTVGQSPTAPELVATTQA